VIKGGGYAAAGGRLTRHGGAPTTVGLA
jgi:hypothetical protein